MTPDVLHWQSLGERYAEENRKSCQWILDRLNQPRGKRPAGLQAFVDTKFNPLTGSDYTAADGLRGPDFTYGWIQGRALEALCTHAAFFEVHDGSLAANLDAAAQNLYHSLTSLVGEAVQAAFCYNRHLTPVVADGSTATRIQHREPGLRTYADIFVVKGLIAAAHRFDLPGLSTHLIVLADCVRAVEEGRFQLDESCDVSAAGVAAQSNDYGPRMILMGASALLKRLGIDGHSEFAHRFVEHVLEHHCHQSSGLITNVPQGRDCNIGHGIELVGLAMESLSTEQVADLLQSLRIVLQAHLERGFSKPGIVLHVRVDADEPVSGVQPWWILPEAIRATAQMYEATGDTRFFDHMAQADRSFFTHYRCRLWPLAYQTLTVDGPIDHVPATPDLDPAYHTGLSLLTAIEVSRRLQSAPFTA